MVRNSTLFAILKHLYLDFAVVEYPVFRLRMYSTHLEYHFFLFEGKHFLRQIIISPDKETRGVKTDLTGAVVRTECAGPREDNG